MSKTRMCKRCEGEEFELRTILDDLDLYADEMLAAVAQGIGLSEPYARVVEALPR